MKLIHELMESRLYRNEDTLEGKKAEDLAKIFFLMVLTVEMLRFGEEKFAKDYAKQTIQYGDFEHMRVGCTDMGNLASVLSNQDHYAEKIETDGKISVPLLQFKTYLRGVRDAHSVHSNDRNFFLKLEQYLNITDNKYKNFRRIVGDWEKMSKGERNTIITSVKNEYNTLAQNNDLIVYFKDHYKKLLGESLEDCSVILEANPAYDAEKAEAAKMIGDPTARANLLAALRKSKDVPPVSPTTGEDEMDPGVKYTKRDAHLEEIIAKIATECSEAIEEMKGSGKFLYRGFDNYPNSVFVAKTREDRKPLGTEPVLFDLANAAFTAAGFKATRKNSMSCTSVEKDTEQFGDAFYILPANGYGLLWSEKVRDFGTKFGLLLTPRQATIMANKYKKNPIEFVKEFGFMNDNLYAALQEGHEISISGKYYAFEVHDARSSEIFKKIMGYK